ncbi:hypothetical protein AB0I77_27850 [Streptomyces sp. NPDC050619]|uniref:hypothetical protein n=1 Tax=Streptomyces sp. NPDC050619 TaxID=3157214 RepID=UPI00343D80A9
MKNNRRLQGALSLIAASLLVGAASTTANAAPVRAAATDSAASFPKQDPAQCTAFAKKADAKNAADTGKEVIGLWTSIFDLPEAQKLYDAYLTPGPVTHTRTEVGGKNVLAEFRNADETKKAVSGIVGSLKSKLATRFTVPGVEYDLGQAGLGADVPIAWSDLETTPGFMAGGLSGVELADQTFVPDNREITGKYSLAVKISNGKPKATLNVHRLTLTVRDSIDFCPGNLGSGLIRDVSLGLSRLERTPYRDTKQCAAEAKCFYARPALFEVTVPLNDVSVDVTDTFFHSL